MRQELLLLPFLLLAFQMPYGLFRASHSHNPAQHSHTMQFTLHFMLILGGSLNHRTTLVQAHRGSWFMTLVFEILRLIKNFKIKNMVYFIY